MRPPMLKAGAAKLDITPPLDVPYLGSPPERFGRFQGVHDPLYARALVVSNGRDHWALLSVDAIGISRQLLGPERDAVEVIRERACVGIPLKPEAVMIAATHAHSVPETYGILRLWERADIIEWADDWCSRLAKTVKLAWDDLKPAAVRVAHNRIPEWVQNRRTRFENSTETHPVDDTIRVLRFERQENTPPILLASAACHPVIVQVQPQISADFPGVACRTVEDKISGDAHCLFLQGAAGDLNPICGNTKDWQDVQTWGERLATAILEAETEEDSFAHSQEKLDIAADAKVIHLNPRDVPAEDDVSKNIAHTRKQLEQLQENTEEFEKTQRTLNRLQETRRLAAFGKQPVPAEIQALRLGDLVIVGVPGELFCELGNQLRHASPARMTLIAEQANGSIGYIAPKETWDTGGYEVSLGPWSRIAQGQAEELIQAAVGLLVDNVYR